MLLGSGGTFLILLGSMFLAILFYLSWYLNLLGGPRLGAEIVILTSSNSAVPLRCHVVFDPPGTHKFVKRGCDLEDNLFGAFGKGQLKNTLYI